MEKNLDLIACTPARYRRFSRKCSWAASKETRARGLVRFRNGGRDYDLKQIENAFRDRLGGKRGVRSAECAVWKMRSVENAESRK